MYTILPVTSGGSSVPCRLNNSMLHHQILGKLLRQNQNRPTIWAMINNYNILIHLFLVVYNF